MFGSVVRSDFRPDSDLDFLVSVEPDTPLDFDALLAMKEELAAQCGRQVDLVEKEALRNPWRKFEILRIQNLVDCHRNSEITEIITEIHRNFRGREKVATGQELSVLPINRVATRARSPAPIGNYSYKAHCATSFLGLRIRTLAMVEGPSIPPELGVTVTVHVSPYST